MDFAGYIQRQQVSIINLTPGLFNQIVQQQPRAFEQAGDLMLAGEAVDAR